MKMTYTLLIACALPFPGGALYGLDGWMTDMEKAKLQAEKQKKDLFIVYKGNSWNPEEYGTPERFLSSGLFKMTVGSRFLLVEQAYPSDYKTTDYFPSFTLASPEATPPGKPPAHWFAPSEEKQILCVLSTPDGMIYKTLTKDVLVDSNLLGYQMGKGEAEKKEILDLGKKITLSHGKRKYRLVGNLSKLLPKWDAVRQFSPLYRRWHEEVILNDHTNQSDLHKNPVAEMPKYCWEGLLVLQGGMFALTNLKDEPFPEHLRSGLSSREYMKLKYLHLLTSSVLGVMSKPVALEDALAEAHKKLNMMTTRELPPSTIRYMERRLETSIRLLHFSRQMSLLGARPDEALQLVNNLNSQPWPELQERQLLQICTASCYLKKGDLETGLGLLKAARDMAPWTEQASLAHADFLRISKNRNAIHTLWQEYKNGTPEAEKAFRDQVRLTLNLISFDIKEL